MASKSGVTALAITNSNHPLAANVEGKGTFSDEGGYWSEYERIIKESKKGTSQGAFERYLDSDGTKQDMGILVRQLQQAQGGATMSEAGFAHALEAAGANPNQINDAIKLRRKIKGNIASARKGGGASQAASQEAFAEMFKGTGLMSGTSKIPKAALQGQPTPQQTMLAMVAKSLRTYRTAQAELPAELPPAKISSNKKGTVA